MWARARARKEKSTRRSHFRELKRFDRIESYAYSLGSILETYIYTRRLFKSYMYIHLQTGNRLLR